MRRARTSRTPGALPALAALLTALLAAACHDLPDLGTCGNGIVEAAHGEACDDGRDNRDTGPCTTRCELQCMREAMAGYVSVGTVGVGPDAHDVYCPGNEFRCGGDSICRAPSGEFEPLAPALSFDVVTPPTIGDVDNDGLPDLVGSSATNIYLRFGSADDVPLGDVIAQDAPASDSPFAIFEPAPDASDPAQSDLLLAVPTEGIALLRSDGERFAPELDLPTVVNEPMLGPQPLGLVVRDPDPNLGEVVIAVASRSMDASIRVKRIEVEAPNRMPPAAVSGQDLPACVGPGPQPWRTVDVEAYGDRRAFVIVTQRDNPDPEAAKLEPWHVCRYTQVGGAWTVTQLDFQAPTPVEVVLASLDDDPCLELALRVAQPMGAMPMFAQLDATGPGCGFAATPVPLRIDLPNTMPPPDPTLLAAGQITTGGFDELALGSGVYRQCTGPGDCGTSPLGTFVNIVSPTRNPWRDVALVNLNGDDSLDLVASRGSEPDVDVVRGGLTPNVYRASTSGGVTSLVAGDFDGDRLGDVAMSEVGPMNQERLVILFGTSEGIVALPRVMSGLGGALRLERLGQIGWLPTSRGDDGIDDLAVIRADAANPMAPPRAGVVFGDAARLMTTPRFPPTATSTTAQLIDGVAAGAFRAGSGVEVLAFVGNRVVFYDPDQSTWVASSEPLGDGQALHHPVVALRDEARPARGAASLVPNGNQVAVFSTVETNGVVQIRMQCPTAITTAEAHLRELRAIDVDHDGIEEVAVLSEGDNPGSRKLEIFSSTTCQPMLREQLRDCVDVTSVGGIGAPLVALCRTGEPGQGGPVRGVYLIRTDSLTRELIGQPLQGGDARFVTAADYDGNGVIDVAVGVHRVDEVGIQLLRQCPAHDTRACQTSR